MREFATAGSVLDERPAAPAGLLSHPDGAAQDKLTVALPTSASRRGVLDGAFAILEALATAEGGLGLTALAGSCGLAKTSSFRLAEQLVALGALQRVDNRYYIGARIGRIGESWQPNPVLRQAGQGPVRTLAAQSRAIASLRILHEDRLRPICTAAPHGRGYMPTPASRDATGRTASGRVLYATKGQNDIGLPDCWSRLEWRRLRESIRDHHAVVVDQQDAFAGICCVSAPVWWPNGTCAGAVTVLMQAAKPAPNLRDLVVRAARSIGAGLR